MEMYESGELAQTLGVEGEATEPEDEAEVVAPGLTQIENRLG